MPVVGEDLLQRLPPSDEERPEHEYPSDDDFNYIDDSSRPISVRKPCIGGMHAFVDSLVQTGGVGISSPLLLGRNGRGGLIEIQKFNLSDSEEFFLIDTAITNQMSESGSSRPLDSVGLLYKRILKEIHPKNDVAGIKSWERLTTNGNLEAAPSLQPPQTIEEIASEEAYLAVKDEMEKIFCDNFSVNLMQKDGMNSKHTAIKLFEFFDWKSGEQAYTDRKFFLSPQKQTKDEQEKPSGNLHFFTHVQSLFGAYTMLSVADEQQYLWLVKVADIPIANVDAALAVLFLASRPEVKEKVLSKSNPPPPSQIAAYQEQINQQHPNSTIWRQQGTNANFSSALYFAARYVIPIEQDRTKDIPATLDCDRVKEIFRDNDYTIMSNTDAGINCVKTNFKSHGEDREFSVKVYDKNMESIQVAGKVRERPVSNKFEYCIKPTTLGLRSRFANPKFQENGCARIEVTFRGSGWTPADMNNIINTTAEILLPAKRVCSFHNKVVRIERSISNIIAVHCPSVFKKKKEHVAVFHSKKDQERARTNMMKIPETMVEYFVNSKTDQVVGRSIASKVDNRTDLNGFEATVRWIANEAPCNTPITMFVIVHGFEEYLRGEAPIIACRVIRANKVFTMEGQAPMNVAIGQPLDVSSSCGINTAALDKLRFNITQNITFEATGLDLDFQIGVSDHEFFTQPRPYQIYESLKREDFIPATVEGIDHHPKNLCFFCEGILFAVPDNLKSCVERWLHLHNISPESNAKLCRMQVRQSDRFGLQFKLYPLSQTPEDSHDGHIFCERACNSLPIQPSSMELLEMHREKHARSFRYGLSIKDEGRFDCPITTAKGFFAYLIKNREAEETNEVTDLRGKGYYLKHDHQQCCYVKGGKHPEELFSILCRREDTEEIVAEARPTHKRQRLPA